MHTVIEKRITNKGNESKRDDNRSQLEKITVMTWLCQENARKQTLQTSGGMGTSKKEKKETQKIMRAAIKKALSKQSQQMNDVKMEVNRRKSFEILQIL